MRETGWFLLQALALGAIAHWASEAMFWAYPPDDLNAVGLVAVVLAYALACGTVMSVVALTGAGGWTGLVLAGSLFGILIEGVIADMMMSDLPWTLVWTPLAWHMPVTVLAVIAAPRMGLRTAIAGGGVMIGIALLMAPYWPLERDVLPSTGAVLAYQAGAVALALAGHFGLDRAGPPARPARAVLWALPVLAMAGWGVRAVLDPQPARLLVPALAALTIWGMHLSRRPGALGGFRRAGARALWLVPSVVVAAGAAALTRDGTGLPTNVVLALTLIPLGTVLWLGAMARAVRRPAH